MSETDARRFVVVGRINGLHGVRGWVKVYSETQPRDNILSYSPWYLRRAGGAWQPWEMAEGRAQGKGIVARLKGIEERDAAALLMGSEIAIVREQLPPTQADEYYWADLVGLTVRTVDGIELGRVDYLIETGANDVLVVRGERERLIPFLLDEVVTAVDLGAGTLTVDWDPEF